MTKKYNIEDYYYVNYVTNNGYARMSLMRCEDDKYYDIVNDQNIDNENVIFTKSLALYTDCTKSINDGKAKKLAEPHYAEFQVEFIDNCANSCKLQQYLELSQVVTI